MWSDESHMISNMNKNLKKIKTFTMRGKKYNMQVKRMRDARGKTEAPDTVGKTVYIDDRESGKSLLATLIDEALHTAMWELDNDVVDVISDDMATLLWRAGLRFKDE